MTQEARKQQESYNTTDLAGDLAKQFGMPKAQALRVVTATFALIGNAVSRDAVVRLHQFGNFKRLETKERQGRNPKTGEPTTIEASARPHFVASQTLKAKVKSGEQESISAVVAAEEAATGTAAPAKSAKPAQQQKKAAAPARKPIARKPASAPAPAVSEEPAADGSAIDEL
mgnify:CR=1 FL=1